MTVTINYCDHRMFTFHIPYILLIKWHVSYEVGLHVKGSPCRRRGGSGASHISILCRGSSRFVGGKVNLHVASFNSKVFLEIFGVKSCVICLHDMVSFPATRQGLS